MFQIVFHAFSPTLDLRARRARRSSSVRPPRPAPRVGRPSSSAKAGRSRA